MEKSLFIITLSVFLPVYALCPVAEDAVCTLPNNNNQLNSLPKTLNKETNTNSIQGELNPMTIVNPYQNDGLNQNLNRDLNYNSSCQFGNCLDSPNNKLSPKQF